MSGRSIVKTHLLTAAKPAVVAAKAAPHPKAKPKA